MILWITNSYIKSVNKYINIMEDNTTTMVCVETFKNVLSSTIDKLYKTIDFLQNEIEEENLFKDFDI